MESTNRPWQKSRDNIVTRLWQSITRYCTSSWLPQGHWLYFGGIPKLEFVRRARKGSWRTAILYWGAEVLSPFSPIVFNKFRVQVPVVSCARLCCYNLLSSTTAATLIGGPPLPSNRWDIDERITVCLEAWPWWVVLSSPMGYKYDTTYYSMCFQWILPTTHWQC